MNAQLDIMAIRFLRYALLHVQKANMEILYWNSVFQFVLVLFSLI